MKNVLIICLIVITCTVFISCGGGKSSTGPDGGGGGTDVGTISKLSGDKAQLVLKFESEDEAVFTILRLFGNQSCLNPV